MSLVVHRHAGNIGALQLLAHGFGLLAIEAGEACANQRLVALGHRLGERIGLAQQTLCMAAGRLDALLRFRCTFRRADLDDPARPRDLRLGGAVLQRGLLLCWLLLFLWCLWCGCGVFFCLCCCWWLV